MALYRFSFLIPSQRKRVFVVVQGGDMNRTLDVLKAATLRHYPDASGWLIESDQGGSRTFKGTRTDPEAIILVTEYADVLMANSKLEGAAS